MKYQDYRPNIRSGDIIAQSHEGWSSFKDFKSQMIRVFTRSTYSHVGIAVVLFNRVFILEQVVPYVRLYPLSMSGNFYHISMPDVKWDFDLEEKAFSYIGSPYSQWKAVKAFFKTLADDDVSECAALVDKIMSHAGIDLGTRQTPDAIVLQCQLLGSPIHYVENKLGQ